jgi:5-methylcytosine-specific restriction endonuclease McrA
MRYAPITALSQELVKFDLQQMENPHISGVEYQQGSLSGYEVREYLLEQWNRQCAYCGAKDVPLQIEHIVPRAKGGTSRISNLTLACEPCNLKKGTQNIREFLTDKPDVLKRLLATASAPLKDATAVNTTRWALHKRLKALGLPVECGSGGRTKYNRAKRALPKTHWCDAACLGASTPEQLISKGVIPLLIRATGHGTRQMCGLDKYGFPIRHRQRQKSSYGYKTGDLVKAIIPKGKYAGTHIGRVTIRSRPSFGLNGFDVHPKYLKVLQQQDGYSYQSANMAIPPSPQNGEGGMANGCGERRASA